MKLPVFLLAGISSALFFSETARAQTGFGNAAPVARISSTFSSFVDFETRFSSWRGTRGSNVFDPTPGKGSQFYSPFTAGADSQGEAVRFQMRLKSGYVNSNHAGQQASIDTMLDTQITGTWTYIGAESYQAFFAIATNVPTGTSVLRGNQRLTRMDPDLVDVGSYGVGFNFNPTVGIVFAVDQYTAISVGAGYAWQGSFNREALNPASVANQAVCFLTCPPFNPQFDATRSVDPGDVVTANVNTSSIFGNLSIKSAFALMTEGNLKLDGVSVGRSGAKYSANTSATYKIDPRWTLLINGSWSFAEKNKITTISGALATEPKNSNSNIVIGSIQPMYAVSDKIAFGPNYSVLWRSENYYDIIEDQFISAKLKQSAGAIASYAIGPNASIRLQGSYFWIHADPGAYLTTLQTIPPLQPAVLSRDYFPPSLSYTGWTAMIAGRLQF